MQRYERYKDSGIDWLGEIPEHWEVKALKFIAKLESGQTIGPEKFLEKGYPVYGGNGFRGYTSSFTNDGYFALIGRQGALCGNVNYAIGKFYASEHAVVVYPLNSENVYWLGEIVKVSNLNRLSQSAAQPGIAVNVVKNLLYPYPPKEEQSAIARFLDEKCEQIDRAVAQKERVIELLNERRQIVIQRAVTRGLNPDVPLRDSGIDWIGQIPAHWQVTRLKSVFTFGKGLNITKENLQDQGIPVVNYGQVHSKLNTGTGITSDIIKYVSSDYLQTSKRALVKCNDFIFADTSEDLFGAGNCVFVDVEDLIFAGYHTIILKSKTIDGSNKYLAYLFKINCWRSQIRSLVTGIKVYSITNSILSKATIILPPNEEQEKIAAYLDTVNQKIDRAVALKREEIEKLKEYKQTLINSAVTGKIKIA